MALTKDEQDQLLALVLKIETKAEAMPLYNHVRHLVRDLSSDEAAAKKRQFTVGDKVWFDAKTRGIVRGTITKIMTKNVKVKADSGMSWTVFPTFLNHV